MSLNGAGLVFAGFAEIIPTTLTGNAYTRCCTFNLAGSKQTLWNFRPDLSVAKIDEFPVSR